MFRTVHRQQRVALVTAAARGLGRMTARLLAERGMDVVFTYRHSEDEAQTLVQEIRLLGVRSRAVRADAADPNDTRSVFSVIDQEFGRLDVLVNNAGPFIFAKIPFAEAAPETWEEMIRGNLTSALLYSWHALPRMRAQHFGRIVHLGFDHAGEARGWPGRAVYAAAKVALASFTRSLALEEAPYGITVNMVCPGNIEEPFKTQRIAQVRGLHDARVPVGRPGCGEDVARVIAFLTEEDADFFTGNVLYVTGGQEVVRERPLSPP